MSRYLYDRGSKPIVAWTHGIPPAPTRAADNVSLGSVTIIPGGPEAIQDGLIHLPDGAGAQMIAIAAAGFVAGYLLRGILR